MKKYNLCFASYIYFIFFEKKIEKKKSEFVPVALQSLLKHITNYVERLWYIYFDEHWSAYALHVTLGGFRIAILIWTHSFLP